MAYNRKSRAENASNGLSKSIERLEAAQKRSESLDLDIKKGLIEIFPELAIDYDEIAHSAYLSSSFSASIDYKEQVRQLGIEAKEIANSNISSAAAADIKERIDDATDAIRNTIMAKERLAEQLRGTSRKAKHIFLVYSDSKLDSITRSYIESEDSELRMALSKYKLDRLIITASCKGMMVNGEYSDVLLRYKTLASSYRRIALNDAQARRVSRMLKDGSISSLIQEYVQGIDSIFNANIVPRLVSGKGVLEIASEVYYYEDYNDIVHRAQSDLIKEILARL
ncbi:MAG: hypothetical protein ACP5MZ_03000 [Candidatus Micrarchaeia archaeon]